MCYECLFLFFFFFFLFNMLLLIFFEWIIKLNLLEKKGIKFNFIAGGYKDYGFLTNLSTNVGKKKCQFLMFLNESIILLESGWDLPCWITFSKPITLLILIIYLNILVFGSFNEFFGESNKFIILGCNF